MTDWERRQASPNGTVSGEPLPLFTDADVEAERIRREAQAEADSGAWSILWQADSRIFLPDWSNKPEQVTPSLKLNSYGFGSAGNLVLLAADPKAGKSALCEAICAAFLNPESDSFGFSVHTNKRLLYVDTERSNSHHWESFERMCRRAKVTPGNDISNVVLYSLFRSVPTIEERRKLLYAAMDSREFGVVIIDGIADFVSDPNDLAECAGLLLELTAKANFHGVTILCTLHTNPGDTGKPRGHLGSELLRRVESTLVLTHDRETGIRTVGMNAKFGSNRADRDDLETSFQWSSDHGMFVHCNAPSVLAKPKATDKRRELVKAVFQSVESLTYTDLITALMKQTGTGESNCKKKVPELVRLELIRQTSDERYVKC